MRYFWRNILLGALVFPYRILAQNDALLNGSIDGYIGISEGWRGFGDTAFLINLTVSLLLATGLSAIIGFHPRTHGKPGSPSQLEKPKAYVVYGVVGAVIGTLVLKYGPIVGLVVFGIGGLLRFRTNLGSPLMTGKAILVTLIGLCCGLNLPHVAILVTAFGFFLIYILERREVYRIVVKGLNSESLPAAAQAYKQVLSDNDCTVVGESKNFSKFEVSFVFSSEDHNARGALEKDFAKQIPANIRGSVDWNSG